MLSNADGSVPTFIVEGKDIRLTTSYPVLRRKNRRNETHIYGIADPRVSIE